MGQIPALALASILTIGALVGRLVCGFACPFGFLQEILFRIPSKKIKLPRAARLIKYAALALLVFLLPALMGFRPRGFVEITSLKIERKIAGLLSVVVSVRNPGTEPVASPEVTFVFRNAKGAPEDKIQNVYDDVTIEPGSSMDLPEVALPDKIGQGEIAVTSPQSVIDQKLPVDFLYYCRICPKGTLTATIPGYFSTPRKKLPEKLKANTLRLCVLAFFLVLMVLVSRPFCRTFCPLGATYALMCRFALVRMTIDKDSCVQCGRCDKACPVDLDVRNEVGGAECISCGDCAKVCPKSSLRRVYGL
jgi:ferredoxin